MTGGGEVSGVAPLLLPLSSVLFNLVCVSGLNGSMHTRTCACRMSSAPAPRSSPSALRIVVYNCMITWYLMHTLKSGAYFLDVEEVQARVNCAELRNAPLPPLHPWPQPPFCFVDNGAGMANNTRRCRLAHAGLSSLAPCALRCVRRCARSLPLSPEHTRPARRLCSMARACAIRCVCRRRSRSRRVAASVGDRDPLRDPRRRAAAGRT
jgi:hypothetical protein